MGVSTGWFGISGAKGRGSTKVHAVFDGKTPLCGAKVGPGQEYQWCADGIVDRHLECRRCKKMANREALT